MPHHSRYDLSCWVALLLAAVLALACGSTRGENGGNALGGSSALPTAGGSSGVLNVAASGTSGGGEPGGGSAGAASANGGSALTGGVSAGGSAVAGTAAGGVASAGVGSGGVASAGGSNGGAAPTPSAGCNKAFAAGTVVKTFDVKGVQREVALYVPQGYAGDAPLPLIFTLHGSGGNGPSALSSMFADFKKLADARGFFVAAMTGFNGLWDVGLDPTRPDDAAFAAAILDWAANNLCVDAQRVFSTGFSGGARESSYLPCALPGRFRAVAPVAGIRHDPPCGMGGVSIMAVHGTADTQNAYDGCPIPCRGGEWGESVEAAVADWVASDACTGPPTIDSFSATVERQTWNQCGAGTEVVFYKVAGATHTWSLLPNIATEVVDFFLSR